MRALLFLLLLSLLSAGLRAQPEKPVPVPPAELKLPVLKAHVEKALADPKRAADLKEFADRLDLTTTGLSYARKGERWVVRWDVEPKKGASLVGEERLLKIGLEDWLGSVISQGSLLTDETNVVVVVVIGGLRLPPPDVDPVPPRRPAPRTDEESVPAVPRMSSVMRWAVVPNPPGSCAPASFHLYEIPVPVYPPAVWHGIWRADELTVERRPQMERAVDDEQVSTNRAPDPFTVSMLNAAAPRARDIDTAGLTASDGERLFWRGRQLYFAKDHAEAASHLRAAVKVMRPDARPWLFLVLAERARGEKEAAQQALARAAALHRDGKPRSDAIGQALERVQGTDRMWLRDGLDRRENEPGRAIAGR